MIQSLSAAINVSSLQLAQNNSEEANWSKEQQAVLCSAFPGVWHIQLRSLNHRFFELNCQLPDFVVPLELPLRKLLQRSLLRGRVELRLSYVCEPGDRTAALVPDLLEARLRELQKLRSVAAEIGLELPMPNTLELLRDCTEKPGAISISQAVETALLGFCRAACCQLIRVREREGRELYAELLGLHGAVVRECEGEWDERIAAHYRCRLQKKYHQFLRNGPSEKREHLDEGFEERLLSELGWLLARGDVREEFCRLKIHAQQFLAVMDAAHRGDNAESCCAKELDFLLQEMNREANTLAAKSPLVELQQLAVRLRVLIEQMREQIKNVL